MGEARIRLMSSAGPRTTKRDNDERRVAAHWAEAGRGRAGCVPIAPKIRGPFERVGRRGGKNRRGEQSERDREIIILLNIRT